MNPALDPRDVALFSSLPLLMAPRFGELPILAVGHKRLIAGDAGIFLEVRSPALHACLPIQRVDTPLPYGPITAFVSLAAGPVPTSFIHEAIERAVQACPNETALAVMLDPEGSGYRIEDVPIDSATPLSVRYADDLDDDRLVFDIHSHGVAAARFSAIDDTSDRSRRGPHIALVFGTCTIADTITLSARLCCAPYLLPLPVQSLQRMGVIA